MGKFVRDLGDFLDGTASFTPDGQLRQGILNDHSSWYGACTFEAFVYSEDLEMDGMTQMSASLPIETYLMNPPETSVIIVIDPKTAKTILDTRNGQNRPPKPNKVQQFAADMTRDRWGLTGDTIKFGTN